MNKKLIISIALIFVFFILISDTNAVEVYGDKTCTLGELFPGMPIWFCMNPNNGGMDHSFFTYEAMHNYYVPPRDENIIIPDEIIVYAGATTTTLTVN